MSGPIRRAVGQVFVPVSDMARSAAWYAALLDFDPGEVSHGGAILDIPVEGETRLALDSHGGAPAPGGPPRFFLWTDDMAATVDHLHGLGIDLVAPVEDIGSVLMVRFDDPDGNPLMVCQRT